MALTNEYMQAWRESKGPCSVEGCGGLYMARGLCQAHYKRLLKYGDPLGKPAPRAKKVVKKKPPRKRKYRICLDHKAYRAGCPRCQAEARLYNRDYMSNPVNRERRNARESRYAQNDPPRSVESRARAAAKAKAKNSRAVPFNTGTNLTSEQINLIFSDLPALAVALMIGRSVQAIHHYRHKRNVDPSYVPQGASGLGLRWTPEEDAALLALPNKDAAEALGRTYEAVKWRRKHLRAQTAKGIAS